MSRTCLTANTTWYVDPNGDDSWTGDVSNPWKTAQYGFEKVQRDFDGSGYSWGLQLNDGDHYVPSGLSTFCALNGPMTGAGGNSLTFNIIGNRTTPANCRINHSPGQYGFSYGNNVVAATYGFKMICPTTGGVGAIPFFASNGGACDFDDIIFGANPFNVNCYSVSKGTLLMLNGSKSAIIGNTPIMFAAEEGGVIKVATNIDIPTALTFTTFAETTYAGSFIALTHATYTGAGAAGCTGKKGSATNGSSIRIDGNTAVMLGNVAATHDSSSAIA